MDPNTIASQQAIASLSNIAPFLWPFVLLSLGVALTPVSPISWSYSTWLLFIIPLIITVFAPIRTFSGPLRYAYLEYASMIATCAVSLLKAAVVNFTSIPTLALPALFFLPVLPILFFVFFPALPIVWHFIAYHYRHRLKAVTTSVAKTNASLDLAMARARQAMVLAHMYEKQALYTVSTTPTTPLLALPRHSTDFGTPVLKNSEGQWLIQSSGTLGADLAGRVLNTEKQMVVIENASPGVLALSEQAVATATEGDMEAGEELAENAALSLEDVVKQVDELCSIADQARSTWVEFRNRFSKIITSASSTNARLDLAVTQARRAVTLAHTYEQQALAFIVTTQCSASQTFALHNTDFFKTSQPVEEAQQTISGEKVRELGSGVTDQILLVEAKFGNIEVEADNIRALLEQAITASVDGDVETGETKTASAADSLTTVLESVQALCSISDDVRQACVEFRSRLSKIIASASRTTTRLDLAVTQARRAVTLAHTYEQQALAFVSTTRRPASQTLALHDADFFETSQPVEQAQQTISGEKVRELGSSVTDQILLVEAKFGNVEVEADNIRALLEQAVTASMDGDLATGETKTASAADILTAVLESVQGLCSRSDDVRQACVEFCCRLSKIIASASTTTTRLDLAITQARRAVTLAHTYEQQALAFVSTTRRSASQTLALHDAAFIETSQPVAQARQTITGEAEKVRELGSSMTDQISSVEREFSNVEDDANKIRVLLEEAITASVDGDVETGETKTASAADFLTAVLTSVDELCTISDEVRQFWVQLSVESWTIP